MTEAKMQPDVQAGPGRWWIAVALLAALVFANAVTNDLVYDAHFLVRSNATFRQAEEAGGAAGYAALLEVFREEFWEGYNETQPAHDQLRGQALYRPLMLYTLGAVYLTFGDSGLPFNLLNILLHVAASLLVLRLAWVLSRNRAVAVIAGLVFAAHPIHSEAVSYAAGLGETQAVVFSLAAMLLYLGAASREGTRWPRLLLAVACFAAALFTKESAAVVLVLLVLLDLVRGRAAPAALPRLGLYGLFALVIVANVAIRLQVCGHLTPDTDLISRMDNPLIQEDFATRVATGATLFARALHLFLVPVGQSADYSFNQMPMARALSEPAAWTAFLLCALLAVAGLAWLRRIPAAGFGLLAFLFAFGPVSNIPVPIGTIFGERLLYLPSVGLALAAGAGLALVLQLAARGGDVAVRVTRSVLIAALVVLCVATMRRNQAYASDEVLYADMVDTAPRSARAWFQHGELERKKHMQGRGGDLSRAITDYREAIAILPEFHLAWLRLGVTLGENGEFQRAIDTFNMLKAAIPAEGRESWASFRKQVDLHLSTVYLRATNASGGDPEKVRATLTQFATMLEEQHRDNPDDLAVVLELAGIYLQLHQPQDARRVLEPAVLSNPASEPLKVQMAKVYERMGELDRAREILPSLCTSANPEVQEVGLLFSAFLAWDDGLRARANGDENLARTRFQEGLDQVNRQLDLAMKDDGRITLEEAQGYYCRAQILQNGFYEYDKAMQDYTETLKVHPAHPDVPVRVAECMVAMHRFDEEAERLFQELDKVHPDNPYILKLHGLMLSGLGRHDDAADRYKKAIEAGFNMPGMHALVAKELIDAGRPSDALGSIQNARTLLPVDDYELHNLAGAALFEMDRMDEALQEFQQAEAMARSDPALAGYLPHTLFQQYKTLLRIQGRQQAGMDGLIALDRQLAAQASMLKKDERRAVNQLRPYLLLQQSWGHQNVAALRDEGKAVALLEEAQRICEAESLGDTLRRDILPVLLQVYEVTGDFTKADAIRTLLAPPRPGKD